MEPDIYAVWFNFYDSDGEKVKSFCLPSSLAEARDKVVWFNKQHRMIGYNIRKNGIVIEQEGEM